MSEADRFREVATWSNADIVDELSRPHTHTITPFDFHLLKEAVRRILNEVSTDE